MIAGGLLVRSASQALRMDTGYDGARVINLRVHFPEEWTYTPDEQAARVRDLRHRLAALPGVTAVTHARAPVDRGGRRAGVTLERRPSISAESAGHAGRHVGGGQLFRDRVFPPTRGRGFRPDGGQPERAVVLSASAAERLWPGQDPLAVYPATRHRWRSALEGRAPARRSELVGHRRGARHARRDAWTAATRSRSTSRCRPTASTTTRYS